LPIRSIRYYLPILDELRFARRDVNYAVYLHLKLCSFSGKEIPYNDDQPPALSAGKLRTPKQLPLPW
jgi:hypothetical protein